MVPRKTLFLLVSLFFLIFCYCSSHTFGETPHATDSGSESSDPVVRRLAPGDELTDRKLAVLSKVFSLDAGFLKERYSKRYNSAVAEVSRGNFAPLAGIVSELFGTLNTKQVTSLLETMKAEREAELKKTPADTRFVSFLDKFIAAGERVLDPKFEGKTEEEIAFLKAFDPQFEKIKESNGRFKEKVEQALAGNRQAKDFLKNNYDPKALLSFMDAQRASGNEELARSLAKSLAEADDSGNHSIDFVGPQGAKERLDLGKNDADVDNALSRFSAEQGFGGRTFSPQRHEAPDKTFSFPRQSAPEQPAQSPEQESASPGPLKAEDGPPKQATNNPPPSSGGDPAAKAAFALMKAQCVRCHGPGGKFFDDMSLNADGSPQNKIGGESVSPKEMINRVLVRTLVDKDMPPTGELEEGQKAILRAWASEQKVDIPK